MKGMDAKTGKALEEIDHLKQSIIDILTTPVNSRIMRRSYGSRLLELVDKPI
ncbi:MAG: baseplate assembly protein W, partial [Wolbachia endosymbiont of Homalodisca vitripennis]|nr:baseplate assembly protein W [Wolbachia endosymbiont of Homalodisca vitripennis]